MRFFLAEFKVKFNNPGKMLAETRLLQFFFFLLNSNSS